MTLADSLDRARAGRSLKTAEAVPLETFVTNLSTAWQNGEVRPTSQAKPKTKRGRRRPDPLAAVIDELRTWFDAQLSGRAVAHATTQAQGLARGDGSHDGVRPDKLPGRKQACIAVIGDLAKIVLWDEGTSPAAWSVAVCSPPSRCGLSTSNMRQGRRDGQP